MSPMPDTVTISADLWREAMEALNECAVDLSDFVDHEYPMPLRHYPSMAQRHRNDMGPVDRARAVLAKMKPLDHETR